MFVNVFALCQRGNLLWGVCAWETVTYKTHGSLKSVLITFRADATSVLKVVQEDPRCLVLCKSSFNSFIFFFQESRLSSKLLKPSPGFLNIFQGIFLHISCFFIHFQCHPCTWTFSEKFYFFKPLNTDLWIIQPQKAPYWTNTVSTYKGQPDKANFST